MCSKLYFPIFTKYIFPFSSCFFTASQADVFMRLVFHLLRPSYILNKFIYLLRQIRATLCRRVRIPPWTKYHPCQTSSTPRGHSMTLLQMQRSVKTHFAFMFCMSVFTWAAFSRIVQFTCMVIPATSIWACFAIIRLSTLSSWERIMAINILLSQKYKR